MEIIKSYQQQGLRHKKLLYFRSVVTKDFIITELHKL